MVNWVQRYEFSADTSAEPLARVDRLSVTYSPDSDQPAHALDQASLEIRPGELLGILGESGSGKSTLAAALLNLLPASARYDGGTIRFRGRDLLTLSESALQRIRGVEIALIPQDPALALNPVIRVGDQIAEVLRAHMRMNRRDRHARRTVAR
jgi:peptide/nickel transport system ATP-binding protein